MINSRQKGATGEREFANLIYDELSIKLERNLEQSRSGGFDLIAIGSCPIAQYLNQFAIEVKRYRQVTDAKVSEWWQQTLTQAQDANLIPLLAFRQDRQSWHIVLPLAVISDYLPSKYPELPWTAWLSIEAFCLHVRESVTSHKKIA